MENFWTWPIFKDLILPFVLIFALVFAILERSKLLGEGKLQINAIVGFVVAALLTGVSYYVEIIQKLTIFLGVVITILFIFMLLFGFVSGDKEGDPFKEYKWMKNTLGVIIFVAFAVAILFITGAWDKLWDFLKNSDMGGSILMIIIVIVLIVAVVLGGRKKKE